MRVGVHDRLGVARDRDMALPEQRSPRRKALPVPTHRAAGRARPAACRCRAGRRCRRRSARPARDRSNRCRGCSCRPRDRACRRSARRPRRNRSRAASMRPRCRRGRYQPSGVTAKSPSSRAIVDERAHQQRFDRRHFDRGAGKGERPDRGDLVGRRRGRLSERDRREASRHSRRCSIDPTPSPRRCGRRSSRARPRGPASAAERRRSAVRATARWSR